MAAEMKYHWTSYFSIAVLVTIWGSAFALTSVALEGFSAVGVASGRIMLAALTVAPIAIISGQGFPKTLKHWGWCGLLGVTNFVVPFTLIAWAQLKIPSNIAATFIAAIPLFVLFFSWVLLKDPISKRKWFGFGVGFLGLVWLADPRTFVSGTAPILSYLAIIAACIGMALGGIVIRVMPNLKPIQAVAGTFIVGAVVSMPFGLSEVMEGVANRPALTGLVILGVLPTGIAQILRYFTVKRTSPVFVAVVGYLIPIWAGVLGVVFLNETLTLQAITAYGLIVAGLLISRDRVKKRPQQP